ncbi:MAG: HAMP domain-containing histidine kinase [Myxococcales bacterium]|nr:HAMP domain-containing histidine kinase [Myxococcales bacterium]
MGARLLFFGDVADRGGLLAALEDALAVEGREPAGRLDATHVDALALANALRSAGGGVLVLGSGGTALDAALQAAQATGSQGGLVRDGVADLGRPLAHVLSYAELIGEGLVEPSQRARLRRLQDAALEASRLSRMILDLARLSEGDLPLRPTLLDAVPIAEEAARLLDGPRELRGLGLDLVSPARVPIETDGDLLGRVLENLLASAIRQHRGPAIPLRLLPEGDAVRVEVGLGPAPAAEGDPRLAFCRLAIRALGGRLEVGSSADAPAFAFTLPRTLPLPAPQL